MKVAVRHARLYLRFCRRVAAAGLPGIPGGSPRGQRVGTRCAAIPLTARRAVKHRKSSWARRPAALAERVEQAHALDPVVRRLSDGVVRALPAGPRTDALHGVPFGQPAHPALVRLPLGCWTSAVLLDLFRGTDRAARMLIGAGVAVTVPAAATGLADWSALHRDQQRVGLVHARVPGRAACAVPRLAGRPGQRAARVRPGAVRLRAGRGHRRVLPGRAPGAAAGRGRQPRRAGQPPVRAGLARPVRARASYRTGARCAGSSATCRCWCTGRAAR